LTSSWIAVKDNRSSNEHNAALWWNQSGSKWHHSIYSSKYLGSRIFPRGAVDGLKRNTPYIHSPRPWPDWIPSVESSLSRSHERAMVRKRIRPYVLLVFVFARAPAWRGNFCFFTRQRRRIGIGFPFSQARFAKISYKSRRVSGSTRSSPRNFCVYALSAPPFTALLLQEGETDPSRFRDLSTMLHICDISAPLACSSLYLKTIYIFFIYYLYLF